MKKSNLRPIFFWAMRDLWRRPLESCLLTAVLLFTVTITASPLLLTQAISNTWEKILNRAPSLVVREFNSLGWVPIPTEESIAIAKGVTGVVSARARVWGHVSGPKGRLTVIGFDPNHPPSWISDIPGKGEIVVSRDVEIHHSVPNLTITGKQTVTLMVAGRIDTPSDLAINKFVVVHIDKARELLGLPSGYASDIAINVFNSAEETAILPDLNAAFPRPVRITTRTETAGIQATRLAQHGGMAVAGLVPAILTLCLLVIVTVRERLGQRYEIGLLKALGWTTGNIVSVQVLRAVSISVTAIIGGMLVASIFVFKYNKNWSNVLQPDWQSVPIQLSIHPLDLTLPLLEVTGLVILPFLVATIGTVLRCTACDPREMLERSNF
jgi:hypothetical protein